jgi:uncharacterized protein (DUF1810 family)
VVALSGSFATMASDPFDLQRFVSAQQHTYMQALAELREGRKQSYWVWFVFPQLADPGHSAMSIRYALHSEIKAEAYISHPLLGARLISCAEALLVHVGTAAREIMGSLDDLKLHSSATRFARVAPPGNVFSRVLDDFFARQPDPRTLSLLSLEPLQ